MLTGFHDKKLAYVQKVVGVLLRVRESREPKVDGNVPAAAPFCVDREIHIKGAGQIREMRKHEACDRVINVQETNPCHIKVPVTPKSHNACHHDCIGQVAPRPRVQAVVVQACKCLRLVHQSFLR
mgnify:CR=1 FL=1